MFKFRSLAGDSEKWTRQIIFDHKVYFAKYEELNDPFEYSYVWTTNEDLAQKVEFWSKQHDIYKGELAGKDAESQRRFIEETEKNMAAPRGSKMIGADRVGIFCASEILENHVLWSHYADSHRGLCIEFSPNEDEILKKTFNVNYTSEPGEFNLYRGINHQDVMTRKYADWIYERELRVFYNPGIYSYNPKALKSITFGVNAWWDKSNRETVESLIEECRKKLPGVKLRRVLRQDAAYKFRLQEI